MKAKALSRLTEVSNTLVKITIVLLTMVLCLGGCSKYRDTKLEEGNTGGKPVTDVVEENPEIEEIEEVIPVVENAKQIQINNDITHQTIEGFGASFSWYSDWMTMNANDQDGYDLFFSDAKTTIIRFKNTYKYNGGIFSPKTELEIYQEAQKRAAEYGEDIKVLMCSWSPAAYLKENGKINGGASIKKDENGNYMYKEYGQYWLELVQAYEAYGTPIDYISIQNEIDFVADYDGCEFGIIETSTMASYAKAYLAVYEALQTMENPPKMMGPETMTVDASQIQAYMKEVFEQSPESVYGIAHHLYAGGTAETPNSYMTSMFKLKDTFPNLSKWQTEFYRGDFLQTTWIIYNSMVYEDLNAYLYWDGVWAQPEGLIGYENPWSKGNWVTEKGYEVHDKYYAIRHYSEFIRPGYKRIDVAPTKDVDLLISAYASDSQDKVVVVALNKSNEDKLIQLNFAGYKIEESGVYTSLTGDGYTQEDLYQFKDSLEEYQTVTIPTKGVITIDLKGKKKDGLVITSNYEDNTHLETVISDTAKKATVNKKEITIGKDNSAVWNQATGQVIENVANGDNGAKGEFKTLWSDNYLYIKVDVKDKNADNSGTNYIDQDSIEVFINEENTKATTYGKGDHHYIITRENKVQGGTGAKVEKLQSTVTSTADGYVIELAIPFTSIAPKTGVEIGFEIQINDSHGKGMRNYAIKWSSTVLNSNETLEGIGTLLLK